MSNKDRASISDSTASTTFGPGTYNDGYMLINRGANICFLEKGGATAVNEKGLSLKPDEAVNTRDLPPRMVWRNLDRRLRVWRDCKN